MELSCHLRKLHLASTERNGLAFLRASTFSFLGMFHFLLTVFRSYAKLFGRGWSSIVLSRFLVVAGMSIQLIFASDFGYSIDGVNV